MIPESARRATWPELLGHPDVTEGAVKGSAFGLMAFHGGLEGGTAEIAQAVSEATGASYYFVYQPPGLRWHVPSKWVDPSQSSVLADWLSHVEVAFSLHGYGRVGRPRRILLGGLNRELADRTARCLARHLTGFEMVTDLAAIPAELRGLHPHNPVNRPVEQGVQIELPPAARGTSRMPADPAWGPGGAPARVVDALAETVANYHPTG